MEDIGLDEIFQIMSTEEYLIIAKACMDTPKKVSAIRAILRTMTGSLHPFSSIGRWVKHLEERNVIRYGEEGWLTIENVAEVIAKYFS